MKISIAPQVSSQSILWQNFQYLGKVLEELFNTSMFKYIPSQPYMQVDLPKAQAKIYRRSDLPLPLYVYQTRQYFLQLLGQLIPGIDSIQFENIEIKTLAKNSFGKYEIEIHFSTRTRKWPILFAFDQHYVLKGLSRNYQYKVEPITPIRPVSPGIDFNNFGMSRRPAAFKKPQHPALTPPVKVKYRPPIPLNNTPTIDETETDF